VLAAVSGPPELPADAAEGARKQKHKDFEPHQKTPRVRAAA
jgi:hypothetical protein